MTGPNEQPKHSGISAQLFELLKVVFTLVLTGIVGGGITYYYQNRSHREQQEAQELETARQSALTFLREVGDILEQRRHHAFQVLYSVRDPKQIEQLYSSIAQDCYAFYSEIIARIQEGRVGKRSWTAENKANQ